jgi:hypothetical protein
MGSYSDLKIGKVEFGSWKDWVDDSIMILFSEHEKRVEEIPLPPEYEHLLDEGERSPFLSVKYVSNVETLKKRLDFLGFTLDAARQAFDLGKAWEIEETRSSMDRLKKHFVTAERQNLLKETADRSLKRIDMLASSDADSWLAALREVFLSPADADPTNFSELAAAFTLDRPNERRFPYTTDERFRLRFELEAHQTGEVVFDVSELVNNEYCSASDPLTEMACEWVNSRDRQAIHMIVLTEGSTDKFVLESALTVLRPELRQYISFMDFAALRVEGGASFLASIVRAFAGAGVRDRLVAVFDNDTAGCLSESLLSKHRLPDNIRVIRYPDIDLARSYPTLGPTGTAVMDINGSAAGIELYLGKDILCGDNGALIPIQWKGFEASLGRYQGEILDKRGCLERFSRKLQDFEHQGGDPNTLGWGDLSAIIDAISSAFRESDTEFLIDSARTIIENERPDPDWGT